MRKYRIMTFDGGGIRGVVSAILLNRLNQYMPDFYKKTRLFAGTSTGSFIALGLAHGLSPSTLVNLYSEQNAQYIFNPKYFEGFRPKYNNDHLKVLLNNTFPQGLRLKDLYHYVVIPSFQITSDKVDSWQPVIFNNFPNSATRNELVVDVALASSAAPIYFSAYKNYIDGGIIANNPSTAAIAFAKANIAGKHNLDDMRLLSFGTGFNSFRIDADTNKWGAYEWVLTSNPPFPLISLLFDGVVSADVLFSSQLLGSKYYRLNIKLPQPVALDDYKSIPQLSAVSYEFNLQKSLLWLSEYWF